MLQWLFPVSEQHQQQTEQTVKLFITKQTAKVTSSTCRKYNGKNKINCWRVLPLLSSGRSTETSLHEKPESWSSVLSPCLLVSSPDRPAAGLGVITSDPPRGKVPPPSSTRMVWSERRRTLLYHLLRFYSFLLSKVMWNHKLCHCYYYEQNRQLYQGKNKCLWKPSKFQDKSGIYA